MRWHQDFEFHSKMYGSPITGELEPCQCKISVRKVQSEEYEFRVRLEVLGNTSLPNGVPSHALSDC